MKMILRYILRRAHALINKIRLQIFKLSNSGLFEAHPSAYIDFHSNIQNPHAASSNIQIGSGTFIMGNLCLFCKSAKIQIGEHSYIGPKSNIMAFESISIGSNVQISHDVNIYDSNSHSISASSRRAHMHKILENGHPPNLDDVDCAAIVIEDDVWIGFGSAILKGVRIGKGAIIGACSVITKDVESYTIVVGNPQQTIGRSRE